MEEKRNAVHLSGVEVNTILWMLYKMVTPIAVIVIISSAVLFFGLEFLMRKASFANYGLSPAGAGYNVSQFILTYFVIAGINILLMVLLSAFVVYAALHHLALPLMRITRELNRQVETKQPARITVRQSDKLLAPLVDVINRLTAR